MRRGPQILLVVSVLLLAHAAVAKPPGGRGHRGPPPIDRVLERHAERLAIDDETRSAIRGISTESHDRTQTLREELRGHHEALRALLGADTPDEDAVMAQAERISAAELALHKERLRATLKIRALLTPEQRSELVKIHAERRGRKERGGGPPRPTRPPEGP